MNSNKLDATDVVNLLEVIIGETEPDGTSENDSNALFNVKDTITVVDFLLDNIRNAAKHRHFENKLERMVAEEAYSAICEWKAWCAQVEEELA